MERASACSGLATDILRLKLLCELASQIPGGCAGIGRTGTFCAVDIALQRLRSPDYGAVVSAAELKPLVAELRRQRAGMVQTPEQYLFCYQVQPSPQLLYRNA